MSKTAFLFPGQGAQAVGMGQAFYNEFQEARDIFGMADDITEGRTSRLCFDGPMEELTRTANLQPAITAVNLAIFASLEKMGGATFDVCCGHSLGEYSALVAAGVLTSVDALALVARRGELMDAQAQAHEGAMAAAMRMSMADVVALCDEIRQDGAPFYKGVWPANHNADGQIVVSGDPESVSTFAAEAKKRKGRAIPLKVSGAWHSPLIEGAVVPFADELEKAAFAIPNKEVIFNVTANGEKEPSAMRGHMARQLVSPVRWHDTMGRLVEMGVTRFVEIGPGKVLSGIAKKYPGGKEFEVLNVSTLEEFEVCLKALG